MHTQRRFHKDKNSRAGKYKPRLGAPFGALFCKVKIPFGDASVIYIHKIGRRFAKNHTKNRTNPLRIPYNGDRLGFNFSKDNYHNNFTVTDNIGFKCFYGTIEPLEVVIVRNTDVTMLTSAGNYEIRSRLP